MIVDWQTLGMASGAILLGAAGLRAAGAAYGSTRRARAARLRFVDRQKTFAQRLEGTMQWATATRPAFKAWSAARPFRVAGVVQESQDCKSYYLTPVDGRPLPRFEPGQYLTFHLPIDPRQQPLVRCYSLSERPREDYYRVTIKQMAAPVGQADILPGQGSGYFHKQIKVGSTLEVQAPQGAFFLDPTNQLPVVLVGGGIGITPVLSMANSIAHERSSREVYLFAGFGNSSEQPFHENFSEFTEQDNIHTDISYSRPMPADQIGRNYDHRGHVDISRLKEVLPSNNYCFYVCGPPGMMENLVPALREWGVPDKHIGYEAFGPASVKGLRDGEQHQLGTQPCEVDFSISEKSCHWNGEHQSLLELAESEGVVLDYGCRAGNCGQCLVTVQQGQVAHVKEPGVPLSKDECLTCIGIPQSDVQVQA